MATPATQPSLVNVYTQVSASLIGAKSIAQAYLALMQAGPVTTDQLFGLIDQLMAQYNNINNLATALGSGNFTALNTFVTAQVPGYGGTYTTDVTTNLNNMVAIVTWIFNNFPKDSGGFIQGYTLNSNGTRTAASFSTASTAGLQTTLSTLIASIN